MTQPDRQGGLLSPSYLGLLATQFLGAWNDNAFRWLVVPIAKELLGGPDGGGHAAAVALSAGLACFVLPYLLLASVAGWLADRFSKRRVIVACKVAEIGLMAAGVAAIALGNLYVLFGVLFCMGTQSALFGPAKFGSLPEMLRPNRLSLANGVIGLATILATVGGTAVGNIAFELTRSSHAGRVSTAAGLLLGVAIAGWLTSLLIAPLSAANPTRAAPRRLLRETWADLARLARHRGLFRVALGIAFFWLVASLAQLNVDTLVVEQFGRSQTQVAVALAVLAVGVGAGSVLAGLLSGGKVELGLVPLGAAGVAVAAVLLNFATQGYLVWLALLGISGGMFDVPLTTYMQHRSPRAVRGAILAAGNFLSFSGMLLVSGLFYLLHGVLGLAASEIFLVTGLATIPILLYAAFLIPWATVRLLVWLAAHTVYRVRVEGGEHLPQRGGALLVANHVTWLDAALLMMTSSRPLRILVESRHLSGRMLRAMGRLARVIEFSPPIEDDPRAMQAAVDALQSGELVCLFAEGDMTRTGGLQPFRHDAASLARRAGVPVVPVYLAELWGSVFSYEGGRVLWKLPRRWPYPVVIRIGPAIAHPDDTQRIHDAVAALGDAP